MKATGARHCAYERVVLSEHEVCPTCKRDNARKATLFLNARLIVTLQEAVDGPTSEVEQELILAYWLVCPKGKRGRAAIRCYAWADVKDMMWKHGADNLTIKEVWK